VGCGRGGNSKSGLSPPLIALGFLLWPPARGVKSAETVPGLRLGDTIDGGSLLSPGTPGGVKDSYNGEGCLYDEDMVGTCGDGRGGGFEVTCKLALRVCPRAGLLLVGGGMSCRPSLAASLPNDMIDNDRPCPLAGRVAVGGRPDIGALCKPALGGPPRDGALNTLSDNAGL
jgi:hypothetical protein